MAMRWSDAPGTPRQAVAAIAARRRWWTVALLLAAILALAAFAILEGDLPEAFGDVVQLVCFFLRPFGQVSPCSLLFLEESGIPMPMPGDVFVMYVGHNSANSLLTLLAAWLGLIAVVVLGATNLYLISR